MMVKNLIQQPLRLAERVGFEPTRPCGLTDFESAPLLPLRYRSIRHYDSIAWNAASVKFFYKEKSNPSVSFADSSPIKGAF